jgi:hypothetical protein
MSDQNSNWVVVVSSDPATKTYTSVTKAEPTSAYRASDLSSLDPDSDNGSSFTLMAKWYQVDALQYLMRFQMETLLGMNTTVLMTLRYITFTQQGSEAYRSTSILWEISAFAIRSRGFPFVRQ